MWASFSQGWLLCHSTAGETQHILPLFFETGENLQLDFRSSSLQEACARGQENPERARTTGGSPCCSLRPSPSHPELGHALGPALPCP